GCMWGPQQANNYVRKLPLLSLKMKRQFLGKLGVEKLVGLDKYFVLHLLIFSVSTPNLRQKSVSLWQFRFNLISIEMTADQITKGAQALIQDLVPSELTLHLMEMGFMPGKR